MKKGIIVLLIVIMLCSVLVYKLKRQDSSEVLFAVFNQHQFKTEQSNINTYAVLNKPITDFEQMQQYFKTIDQKMTADYEYQLIKAQTQDTITLSRVYLSENKKMTLKLETRFSENTNTYMVLDVVLYKSNDEIIPVKESLEQLYSYLNIKPKVNISMTGIYNGRMTEQQKKLTTIGIMKKMNAKVREDYVTDEVYSVVGYTKKIPEYIYSGKQKININLALRYNSYEDKTYLYLATPVITVEY